MQKINRLDEEKTYTLLVTFLTLITALTFRIGIISIAIGTAEVIIVLIEVIKRRADNALIYLTMFLSTIVENKYFSTGLTEANDFKIYNVSSLPMSRTYHILLIVLLLYVLTKGKKTRCKIDNESRFLVVSWIVATFVTGITLLGNDNNVRNIWGLVRLVIVDGYNSFFTIGLFVVSLRLLQRNVRFSNKMKVMFIAVLKGCVIAAVLLIALKNYRRNDDGDLYLICPLMLYWSPALLLFYKRERKVNYIIYAIIAILIQIKFTVGIPGAWWLSTGVIGLAFTVEVFKEIVLFKKTRITYIFAIGLIAIGIIGLSLMLSTVRGNGYEAPYIQYKLGTAVSLFKFSADPIVWLSGMGGSVGIRVEEIVNIFIEFIKNPFYMLLGKGFGGTCSHYWGIYNWDRTSVFSEIQILTKTYSVFHTGVAEMIINFGVAGIWFVVKWIKDAILSIFGKNNNPWLLVGSIYLMFFYSYYWSMAVCVVMMAYGVYIKEKGI